MMLIKYFFETILYVQYIFLFSKLYFLMYFKFIIIYIDDINHVYNK